jgi:hypothetical protein
MPSIPATAKLQPTRRRSLESLADLLQEGSLAPEVQRRARFLFERAMQMSGSAPAQQTNLSGGPGSAPSVLGNRRLVYVHGICQHLPGFSDSWWAALHDFETTAFGEGVLGQTRLEVVWSDVIAAGSLAAAMRPADAVEPARAKVAAEIRAALADRLDRHAIDAGPPTASGTAPLVAAPIHSLLDIPAVDCVEDFAVYLVNDQVRQEIIDRFTEVVRPLLQQSLEVDIISHSWGTVVAYEGLCELEDGGLSTPLVRNLFTAGAALSIEPVKSRLRPANRDGHRPAMVRRWVNVDAHGDVIGGPLQGRPYQIDNDFPRVAAFGCGDFLGFVNPTCAHGSYFIQGNVAVNRDIFAKFIDAPQS